MKRSHKRKCVQPYRKVFEKLSVTGMSIWDLADAIEKKTGKFVDARRLKRRLKSGQKVGKLLYCEIKEILDIQDTPAG